MKVIDLLNKIANREIKRGTIIKFIGMDFIYDYPNLDGIYRCGMSTIFENSLYFFLDSSNLNQEVEVMEEIGIKSIEELDTNKTFVFNKQGVLEWGNEMENKINELIRAVKQLDRQIKEDK